MRVPARGPIGRRRTTLLACLCACAMAAPAAPAPSPYETDGLLMPKGKIDQYVLANLRRLNIQPANLCSDEVFLRRVYLDVIGTLPTAQEAEEFLKDKGVDKRRALIDRLLQRPEFADYWAMRWSDLLRVRAEFPINLWPNAAQAYHRWIRDSIRDNMPYDRFVREMLTANGSNFRVGQVNFYRAVRSKTPIGIAEAVALSFMGTRADKWPEEKLAGMAQCFSKISYKPTAEWKEEIVFFDPRKPPTPITNALVLAAATSPTNAPAAAPEPPAVSPPPLKALFPDGTSVAIPPDRDPRAVFADWLITPRNPWFATTVVNRLWAWLLGRGIIHEPDDIRPDNKPVNPELLAYLEKELVIGKYDIRHILRLILNSQVYQLSSVAKSKTPEARANFASYPLRRLEAEVLIDALNQITGTTEKYSSPVPEPFTFIPEDQRSIALPDSSITSSFLELFGRPARDTGLQMERSSATTPDQRLYFLNSSHIQGKIEDGPKFRALFQTVAPDRARGSRRSGDNEKYNRSSKRDRRDRDSDRRGDSDDRDAQAPDAAPANIANALYLSILSRFPTQDELQAVTEYAEKTPSKREAAIDIAWALINSPEFLYRH